MSEDPQLIHELRLALGRITRRMRNEKADRSITDSQFSALWNLAQLGECTMGTLSAKEAVTAPSMTRTVQHLEEAGYLHRHGSPDDGRKVLLSITDAGQEFLDSTVRQRDESFIAMLDELPASERAAVVAAAPGLKRMAGL